MNEPLKENGKGNFDDEHDKNNFNENELMLVSQQPRRLTEIYKSSPLTDETTCGVGCCKGSFLQRFANKKFYIFIYGITGAIFGASFSYFNGTMSTMEKRFKIPSRTTGIITVGNDISGMFLTVLATYYTSRGHRPRWIAFGQLFVVIFCALNAMLHFIYGPGEDALKLTMEYGKRIVQNGSELTQDTKILCQDEMNSTCDENSSNLVPQIILFAAQFISGIGSVFYFTLGVAYMDDNIKKEKTPMLVSLSYFIRMLGPAAGYALSSICLKIYISPSLTPTVTPEDPRWLGAWWIGWIVLGSLLLLSTSIVFLFPKTLPRAAARKILENERKKLEEGHKKSSSNDNEASTDDMITTFKRLISNKVLLSNTFSSLFYFFGYCPYWFFMVKYMEIIYKKSAADASFLTGYVGIVFSAFGLLSSGYLISKLKPSARYLAAWNVFVGLATVLAILSYIFIGCTHNDEQMMIFSNGNLDLETECNSGCNCEHVKYSPVCSPDGQTFISPCHAGCRRSERYSNGTKIFEECSCVDYKVFSNITLEETHQSFVINGPCPSDCSKQFLIFLIILSLVKFIGSTGRLSNFLVSLRCVDEKDKAIAMGFGGSLMSMFAFIPAPIVFGYIIDKTCIVWGKTCTGTGNCWLYNPKLLRLLLNGTSFVFVSIGVLFDAAVWYYVKDLKIFDDENIKGPKKKKNKQTENRKIVENN